MTSSASDNNTVAYAPIDYGNNTVPINYGNNTTSEKFIIVIPDYIYIAATFFYGVIFLFAISGNVLVVYVVWKNKDMRNSTNIFLVNLSLADLLVITVCMPSALIDIYSKEIWYLGEIMCKAVPFLENSVVHCSVLTILAISFERYYAICQPLKAQYTCTQLRAFIIIVIVWIFGFAVSIPFIFMTKYKDSIYIDDSIVKVCNTEIYSTFEQMYFVSIVGIFFLLPLIILIVLYSVISKSLIIDTCVIGKKNDANSVSNLKARKQVVIMLAAVVVFFFVCLLPFRVYSLCAIYVSNISSLGLESYYNVIYFARIMFYLNSAVNPVLYNVMSTKFREAFLRALGCGKRNLRRAGTFNTTYSTVYSGIHCHDTNANTNSFRNSSIRVSSV